MIFKPAQLGMAKLDPQELEADKKACRKIGPCGVGKKALYLNSFYIDRRYYLPYGSITRVFKRVAMSSGGFSGKGVFASMAYLVVEYDGGKQKQCNFKDERDVDALLELLAKQQPQIRLLSAAGEQALQECGLGYRTRYVLHAAQQAAEGTLDLKKLASLPDEALFARLMELDGVGKKVANCVCLFGYGRVGRVPVDVWIERLIRDEFAGQDPFPQFGLEAGIVQQYLFFYKRSVG